jgi:phage shock protein PspC (stress-responsive transcriptional regulator)
MNCNEAVAALVASLENGTLMTDAQREHIRTCERCRELLDSAKQFESALGGNGIAEPSLDDAISAAEGEVLRNRTRRVTAIVVGVALLFIAALGLLFFLRGGLGFGLEALVLAVLISAGFAVPILLMIYVMRDSARRRMYKRLKPGRVIAGVCLGLAEKTNVDVLIVRLVFIALLFLGGGIGFWFYIALNVAMPVHPDDRQYLLRFRLRRWWARRNGHAEHRAG